MTNNDKETFESKINEYLETLKNQSKIKLDYRTVELDTMDVEELKQLHDQEIKEKNTYTNGLVNTICGLSNKLKEKDKEILELQAELQDLKIRNHCK